MTDFEAFIAAAARPMDILAGFNRQAVVDAGMKSTLAADGEKAREVYFGPTKFSRKQAHAVRIARETGKSLDQILFIEQQVRSLGTEKEKWKIRLALLSVRGNYETLKRRAKDIVPEVDTPAPESSVRFGKERKGKRTFSATGDARDIAALEYALRRNLDANRPEGPQMYEAFHDLLHNEGAVAEAVPRPLVQIPLPDYISILGGEGDDTILGLSDGTTMTGAEYLMHHHSKDLEVALFHPQVGPVNLYSTKRFANQKQRDLARATLTTCPVPDCRHAADNCEVHHIEPWARGGQTNMNNLSVLCRYHNRTNDGPRQTQQGPNTDARWDTNMGFTARNTSTKPDTPIRCDAPTVREITTPTAEGHTPITHAHRRIFRRRIRSQCPLDSLLRAANLVGNLAYR